ncbi:MAG: XVIPCD domain-containing protein [Arenimonas sp.]
MSDDRKPHNHGKHADGVSTYPADAHDMATYDVAKQAMALMPVPIFQHSGNPHERLFIAAFDGTWNDAEKDPQHLTNIGIFSNQVAELGKNPESRVGGYYVKGVGTQDNFLERTFDGAFGYTYEQRLEQMYVQFIKQAAVWLKEDPQAQIRIAEIGFSRGAEQAAGFARLVHERGIQDWTGIRETRDENGRMHIEYTRPALVNPGQIPQAVGLFDPVGTGEPRLHDRRLPPSVVSGFQIVAEDELRGSFKSTSIIDQGLTPDGRLLGVTVAGAHTNVGNGYHLNGLGIRSGNLMTDYLNALSDKPYLHKTAEPVDPAMNVVHRSEEGMHGLMRINAADQGDARRTVETMAPRGVKGDRENAEPVDASLRSTLEYRNMPITQPPSPKAMAGVSHTDPTQSDHPDHVLYKQSQSAIGKLDHAMGRVSDAASERMAASLTVLAKQEGIQRIDNVVLSKANEYVKAGENVILVQGRLEDPSHLRAYMKTKVAIETPVAESFGKLGQSDLDRKPESQQKQAFQTNIDPANTQRDLQEQEQRRPAISR